MPTFHLIPTLDYELFGDGSGCVDKCLTEPTARCRGIVERHGGQLTLFVEALELACIRDAMPADFDLVHRQLSDMAGQHELELHLHPQWMSAKKHAAGWDLDFDLWRIGDLPVADQAACLDRGIEFLTSYRQPKVFRAGAWAIQPGHAMTSLLAERGIGIDSSVAPGAWNPARGDWFDFRAAASLPYWKAGEDVCCEDDAGSVIEVPIATHQVGPVAHGRALVGSKSEPAFPPGCDGTYHGPNDRVQSLRGKVGKVLNLGLVMLDFSTLPAEMLIASTRACMSRFADESADVPIVAIGHNKNFSRRSEAHLEAWLDWAVAEPDLELSSFSRWRAACGF